MKRKLPALIVTLALSASTLPAANIAWVSFHSADNTPSGAATTAGFTKAPDVGYTALLAANGHTVTRFVRVNDIQVQPDLLTALGTNDLIIISRSVPSGDFQQLDEATAWNGITNPVMILGGFVTRGGTGGGSRLGLTTGETIADVNVDPLRLRVNAPGHPIFSGVALGSTNLMVNPYARRVAFTNANTGVTTNQVGISINNNPIVAGGSVLAVVGTAGSAGLNGMVIGEIPAGVTTVNQAGSYGLGGKRLVFLTGSRESGITSEGAGIYDLFPDGAQLFLNAVIYLTTPQLPKATLPLVGATNLVAGDSWTFNAGAIGDEPLSYQWYKDGQPLLSGTTAALTFPSLDPITDAGQYQLIVTNLTGSATSTVARLEFHTFAPDSITNGIISYWPLEGVLGTKTIDLVSSYDLSLANLSGANVVAGKWGNAFQFNGTNSLLSRINNAGDALPIYQHPDFSVSLWVNGFAQTDRRVFSEGSTTSGSPLLNLGTHNTGADGTVDIYIRNNAGAVLVGDHRHSVATAYDGAWHNVVLVQRDVGGGIMKAQLWVDGVLDSVVITPPARPLTPNTTSIGGILRAAPSAWFAGLIDEVAVWNRALSPAEIGILQSTAITNPPSRVQPLVISSFKADLPALVSGGSTTLRWDVSKDASQVSISPFGEVTAQTVVGIGARSITQNVANTYVLTVNRGVDTLSATTSVAVVEGVAPGWKILDNFDQAQLGNLFASGYWNDTSGNAGQVVSVQGNRALRTTSTGISFLNLRGLSIQETQTCTLFFRVMPGTDNAAGITNIVGLTDKSQRSYGDEFANIGPVVYPTPFTNDLAGITTNGWYLGARNFPGGAIDYLGSQPEPQPALEAGGVYNVWVDITNAPLVDFASDIFTVYIQKEGGAPRTVLFQDYTSDRDLFLVDPVLGGIA
ncbi:MAG: LamG-like jellyroll fold domain-containing protein, partial [Verrucomicrobiota bacterium]